MVMMGGEGGKMSEAKCLKGNSDL